MKSYLLPIAFLLALVSLPTSGAPVLSIDFAERGQDPATTTFPGFSAYFIGSVGSSTLAQTNTSSQAFGALTVTIRGNGPNPIYDDRIRSTPANSGDFTESLLLRDFVFSGSAAISAGLNVTISGLQPNQLFRVRIWSFDSGSPRDRVSDWFAQGTLVKDNYIFNSSVPPTNNTQHQFDFKVATTDAGTLLIQGRRDSATGAGDPSVFLNALEIEALDNTEADLPQATVAPVTVYAGDNALLSADAVQSPPYTYQWSFGGVDIPDATNRVLTLTNLQMETAGFYSVVVSNFAGTTIASNAVTVLPVTNIVSALISYWPMDEASTITPDVTPQTNHLNLFNMDAGNLADGQFDNALMFNGVDELAARLSTNSIGLPVYSSPNYSITMWVKGTGLGQNDKRVFSEASTNTTTQLFTIGTHSGGLNGAVDIFLRNDDNSNPINHRRSTLEAFDGQWHHIAWVDRWGFPSLYVDGVLDTNNFNYTRGAMTANTTSVGGVHRASPTAYFNGLIDDVAVWSRSLTAAEVVAVRDNQPKVQVEAPLITRIDLTPTTVILTLQTTNTTGLTVVESSNLVNPGWSEVMGVVFGAAMDNTVTATFARPDADQRFYRVARN